MSDAIVRALAERNRAGDLDAIPVQEEDQRPFIQRLTDFLKQGAYGEAQPGQRGTWVPSQINAQGRPELAVPGVIQQPAESLQSLMTAPLSDIVRSGDRDAIRAASEASFDVAGALPAAGAAIQNMPRNPAPIKGFRGSPYEGGHVRDYFWASADRDMASDYALVPGSDKNPQHGPNVTPAEFRFRNPIRIDAQGAYWESIPYNGQKFSTDMIADDALRKGHDGLVIRNVSDAVGNSSEAPQTTIAALKRGTVKSPLTGETLFSNPDDPTSAAVTAALAGQDGLSMDKASRMARAKDMGYDTTKTYYHGTKSNFDAFDRHMIDSNTETGNSYGFFATTDANQANMFSGDNGAAMPLHVRAENPLDIDLTSPRFRRLSRGFTDPMDVYDLYTREMENLANTGGHDVIRVKGVDQDGNPQTMAVVRDPHNIRSVDAAFDPAKRDSANLLASNPNDPTTAAILALLTAQQGGPQQ